MDARVQPAHDRGEAYMRKPANKYTAREIGRVKVIEDFLPSPEALVARVKRACLRLATRDQRG